MSFFSRLFGRKDDADSRVEKLIPNADIKNSLGLQVLFSGPLPLNAAALSQALQSYDASLRNAHLELLPNFAEASLLMAHAGWGRHVIRIFGLNSQMPSKAVEPCIVAAHYADEEKDLARLHTTHVMLWYQGYDDSPFEQYVALACVAGVLAQFGGVMVLNEAARSSIPARALCDASIASEGFVEFLREMPLLLLYCGFLKYEIDGTPGVWMRTHGAHLLGLTDLAVHAKGHEEGKRFFNAFENILRYLRDSRKRIKAGHTSQIESDIYFRFRKPAESEYFLENEGKLLVIEVISADEINR